MYGCNIVFGAVTSHPDRRHGWRSTHEVILGEGGSGRRRDL